MKKVIVLLLTVTMLFLTACNSVQPTPDTGTDTGNDGGDVNIGSHTHVDIIGNGMCSVCGNPMSHTVDIYTINDMHGKLLDTNDNIGADELTAYLEMCKKNNENTVILSSGDMWQGTSESNLTRGNIMTEWLNSIGCAAMTLGNHEFDWGEAAIRENLAIADFPFLAINIYNKKSGTLADYCTPSAVVDLGAVEIGIIGAIGDCYSSIASDKVTEVEFKVGDELTELVKEESERLRGEGVDVIIYSLHDGNGKSTSTTTDISANAMSAYYDIELSEGYVDVVFEGHSHQRYVYRDRHGVYHLQGGGDNSGITHASFTYSAESGKISFDTAESIRSSKYSSLKGSDIINALASKYESEISKGNEYLGRLTKYMSSDDICALAARMYAEAGESFFTDYQIVLGGGYLSARSPYDLSAGDVYYKNLQGILPFDNDIVLCSVKGRDLLSKFINTNNSNYYISYTDYGNSVKNSIDQNATYYIVTDTYTAYYAPNRLTVVASYTPGIYARDLIADHFKATLTTASAAEIIMFFTEEERYAA